MDSSTSKKSAYNFLFVFKLIAEPENLILVKIALQKLLSCYQSQPQHQLIFFFMQQQILTKISQFNLNINSKVFNKNKDNKIIDYVITVGGDGTILYAAKEFQDRTPPFITFQKGTLGFLCKFSPKSIEGTIEKIFGEKYRNGEDSEGQFSISRLMRLTANIYNTEDNSFVDKKVVLNEVAITRRDSKLIMLQIFVDNQYITTTTGDGILISSPTGSTAYALSAGGPVVLNGVNTILLVPIAPNSLSFRPICLPSSSTVTIKLSQNSKSNAILSFDGQSNIQLTKDKQIKINHISGQQNCDILLYEKKNKTRITNIMGSMGSINGESSQQALPTWMQRLKLFLGWNQVFKSPACQILSKNVQKID